MKIHSTNYFNTFIEIAEDSTVEASQVPKAKGDNKTVAEIQFEIIKNNPYKYTSDDVFFMVYAHRNDLIDSELEEARKTFFSKGQPCFRASPLTKSYGYGVFSNNEGKVALHAVESLEYENFINDNSIKKLKAMRSKKA